MLLTSGILYHVAPCFLRSFPYRIINFGHLSMSCETDNRNQVSLNVCENRNIFFMIDAYMKKTYCVVVQGMSMFICKEEDKIHL